ncbi:DNA polymerase IV [Trueperella sp. LYQ143]|uniref:DNA polymerase IV n=1 Tax=unclassified Trueperella TaxID=2630174 RepID=UPI0039838FA0
MSRAPRTSGAKRDWGADDSGTPILHVDMDAFFVSVELLDKPELRGRPVAVGGRERGVISAASYEARQFGVNSAMPVAQAKRLCPQLVILPVRAERYRAVSKRIMAIFDSITPLVEQLSVDEAFLDVSGARKMFGSPTQIAQDIRRRIRQQEGVPASIGIAATKHVAKIASAHAKPDGMLLIPVQRTQDFLHSLQVGSLWGVGEKTRRKLEQRGIITVADLVAFGPDALRHLLGEALGTQLFALAMGRDPRVVTPQRVAKSISREQTFFDPIDGAQALRELLAQAHNVAARLRHESLTAWTVGIKVRFADDFSTITRSVTLASPTDLAMDIFHAARALFYEVDIRQPGIRLLGVKAENFADPHRGVQLMLDTDERQAKAEWVMDSIRSKFGDRMLTPGSLVGEQPLENNKE